MTSRRLSLFPLLGACLMGFLSLLDSARAEEPISLTSAERERCLAVLRTGLRSDEFWPAMHAAEALTVTGQGEEVIAALKPRLPQETNDQRRCGLARELARAGDRDAVAVLFAILGDPKSNGRIHAAESLYKVGEIGDGTLLEAAMAQTDLAQLQLMAAAALAKAGRMPALALLRQKLQSEDRLVRNTVCFALARLGDPSDVTALTARLQSETDPLARANLIQALACLGDSRGRELLAQSLTAPEPGIRAAAAEHAGHARCTEYRNPLLKLLDDPALDPRIRAAQSLVLLSRPAPPSTRSAP